MLSNSLMPVVLIAVAFAPATSQETAAPKKQDDKPQPAELAVLKSSVGVWDAEFQVWAAGPDAEPLTFKGVETNRAYGKHWIASDLDAEFNGQKIRVHSIIGYDLDKKKLVGTVVDDGPYAASMTGQLDKKSGAVTWTTKAKAPNGTPMVQTTIVTQMGPNERILVLMNPAGEEGDARKFMEVKFVKRK